MTDRSAFVHRLVVLVLAIAGASYLFTAAGFIDSPLRFDESEWPPQARGILEHGVPMLEYSENPAIWLHPWLGYDAVYGMWHPPLYLYSLAGAALAFGFGDTVMRGTSLAWFLGSLWLLASIAGRLSPPDRRATARALAVALAVLTPLLAEGSLYLEIDNTCLAFTLLLVVHQWLRYRERPSAGRLTLVGIAFAVALTAKLTTPLLLLGSLGLFHLLDRRWRRAIVEPLVIGGIGAALFAVGYWAYCSALDYPASYMFDISYLGKRSLYDQPHGLRQALHSLRWHLVWLSPPLVALLLAVLASRVAGFARRRRLEEVDLPLLFLAVSFAVYVPWAGMLGKYMVPAALIGLAAAAPRVVELLGKMERIPKPRVLVAAALTLCSVHLAAVPALQVRPPGSAERTATWSGAILDPRNAALLLTVLAFIGFALWLRRRCTAGEPLALWALAALLYAIAANPVNAAKVQGSGSERSPFRPFDENGFRETAEYLNQRLDPGRTIVAPKDVGYYFAGRHYATDAVAAYEGQTTLWSLMGSSEVCAVVDSRDYPSLTSRDLAMGLPSRAHRLPIGSFDVYLTCGSLEVPGREAPQGGSGSLP